MAEVWIKTFDGSTKMRARDLASIEHGASVNDAVCHATSVNGQRYLLARCEGFGGHDESAAIAAAALISDELLSLVYEHERVGDYTHAVLWFADDRWHKPTWELDHQR